VEGGRVLGKIQRKKNTLKNRCFFGDANESAGYSGNQSVVNWQKSGASEGGRKKREKKIQGRGGTKPRTNLNGKRNGSVEGVTKTNRGNLTKEKRRGYDNPLTKKIGRYKTRQEPDGQARHTRGWRGATQT